MSKSASYKNGRKQQNQISSHFHSTMTMSQIESKCETKTVLTGFDWNGKWVSYIPVLGTLINLSD